MASTVARSYTLSNGIQMPSVGLGTYRVRDQDTLDTCILEALRAGYRLIDTAAVYKNEAAIGNSIKRILEENLVPGLTRADIFLTSKLAPKDQGYDACYKAVLESLQNLQMDYIDLYLIHWPGTSKLKLPDPQNATNRMESWHALEDLYRVKKLRSIGVSNYTVHHLTQLVERPRRDHHHATLSSADRSIAPTSTASLARTMVVPHVHQFEMHPRLLQRDLLEFCRHHRIQVQAYSSLGEGRLIALTPPPAPAMDAHYNSAPLPGALDIMPDLIRKYFAPLLPPIDLGPVIDDEEQRKADYAKHSAQILLRWGLQHGAVVIPKSTQPERIRNNLDLFSFEIDADIVVVRAVDVDGSSHDSDVAV
ncbi:hypothetical protein BGZ70_009040 [Mortierella alpina]|uniref:NADP-dependent oxidoreductase domain-containing protein n=1 Tax=Mortierella alpina TaxID=64518 RepID=A0A9P6M6F1_MORAP|nr:hypothetical protein BGZ70_009040 [Mortierella alpina]